MLDLLTVNVPKGMDQWSKSPLDHLVAQDLAAYVGLAVGQDVKIAKGVGRTVREKDVDILWYIFEHFFCLLVEERRRNFPARSVIVGKSSTSGIGETDTHLASPLVVPSPPPKYGAPGTSIYGPCLTCKLESGRFIFQVPMLLILDRFKGIQRLAHLVRISCRIGILGMKASAHAFVPVVARASTKVVVAGDDKFVGVWQRGEPCQLVLKRLRGAHICEIAAVEEDVAIWHGRLRRVGIAQKDKAHMSFRRWLWRRLRHVVVKMPR